MYPKVALIDVRDRRIVPDTENLGLAYIASFLRENDISVNLHVIDSAQNLQKQLLGLDKGTRIYGFSIFHSNFDFVSESAHWLKSHTDSSFVIAGGLFATEYADKILADCLSIDGVVLGYGEIPTLQLIESYPNMMLISKIANLVTRNNSFHSPIRQLSSSKFNQERWVARDFAVNSSRRPSAVAHVIKKLGCSYRCSFCLTNVRGNRAFKKISLRPAQDLFKEISYLHNEYGFKIFMFHDCPLDDCGKLGLKQLEQFCDMVMNSTLLLAFQCMMNGRNLGENCLHLVPKMRRAGFSQVLFLVGAGNDRDTEVIKNEKDIARKEYLINFFKKSDIEVMLEFFMLNPLSTVDTLRANYLFLLRMKSYGLGEFIKKAPAYLGTSILQLAKRNVLLTEDYSFRNPYGYRYLDDYVNAVDSFFQTIAKESNLLISSQQFEDLSYLINWLKIVFPETLSDYLEEIKRIKDELHENIKNYFKNIFIDCSLDTAQAELPDFENTINKVYKMATSVQYRIFREPDVKKYLLRRLS